MRCFHGPTVLAVAIWLGCSLIPFEQAWAIDYSFTKIADDTVPSIVGFLIGKNGVINESGTVAFVAVLAGNERALYVGNGGALTTIANTAQSDLDSVTAVSINDAGTVAFRAARDNGSEGIFTGSGGPPTPVIDDSSLFSMFGFQVTSINNAGTVGFFANRDGTGVLGYYLSDVGSLTTIVDNGSAGDTDFQSFSSPSLNEQGLVSFGGMLNNGMRGLFTNDGTTLNTLLDQDDGFSSLFAFTGINNSGTVVFTNAPNGGTSSIFTVTGSTVTLIADYTGPFSMFRIVGAINDAGNIAFVADLDAGGCGLYTGGDPVADKVIEIGDPLDGSTVASLCNFSTGHGVGMMNNFGQIAFWAELADGRQGIFRANPDTDGDGVPDHLDPCPNDALDDSDGDGACDSDDACASDPDKTDPGDCGCGSPETDSDGDGTPDCIDSAPNDPSVGQQVDTNECCGGGMPMMMPLMLQGWVWMRRRRKRSATPRIGVERRL